MCIYIDIDNVNKILLLIQKQLEQVEGWGCCVFIKQLYDGFLVTNLSGACFHVEWCLFSC